MPAPSRGAPPRFGRHEVAVLVVALLSSVTGILNRFAFDDVLLVQRNARVHDLGHVGEILASAYWPPPFNPELYRPVASLLIAVQYTLGDGAPILFRLASYALYAGVALALLAFARRVVSARAALVIALLFAAHPVHVEAVALAVNQGELVVALLALLSVTYYLDLRREGTPSIGDWATLAALYLTAALTKEHAFVLPALLVATELWLVASETPLRARVQRLWPGFAALAGTGLIAIIARTIVLTGNVPGSFAAEALRGLDWRGRALTMLGVVPHWFRLLVWPAHLQLDYSPGEIVAATHFGARQALGSALLAGTAAVAVAARKRAQVVTFGIAWCALMLFPVSNVLVPTGIVLAERTLFLPSVGMLIALVAGVRAAAASLARTRWPAIVPPVTGRRIALAAVGVLVVLGVVRSAERELVWRNDYTLYMRSIQDAPRSFRVAHAVGDLLFFSGSQQEAIRIYDRAIVESTTPWKIRADFAERLHEAGADSAAIAQLRLSLAEQPDQPVARIELAAVLIGSGRYRDAHEVAHRAIEAGESAPVMKQLEDLADSAEANGLAPGSVHPKLLVRP